MQDIDFIRETMRAIGVTSISTSQEAAIMAAPGVTAPVYDDVDRALRHQAIVRETIKVFGHDEATWRGIYSRVWIACRNIKEGRSDAEALIVRRRSDGIETVDGTAQFITDTRADRRAFA